jgi:hypothetical protein
LLLFINGCGSQPQLHLGLTLPVKPNALTGRCDLNPDPQTPFASEVTTLRMITYPNAEGDILAQEAPMGETLSIENLPIDQTYDVTLYGKNNSGTEVWRGTTHDIVVQKDQTTQVDILLGRIRDLSCARTVQPEARAFHTATLLKSGQVLLVGGAQTMQATNSCSGCQSLTATGAISIFDPGTGTIATQGQLNTARMLHTATLLSDGSVLIVGGTTTASINPEEPFPLVPDENGFIQQMEIINPDTLLSTVLGDDLGGPRVFHSALRTSFGKVIIAGGIQSKVSPFNLSNATSSTMICDEATLVCQLGPALAQPRAGHAMFEMENELVFTWGGSVGTSYQLERLDPTLTTASLLNVAAMAEDRNLFFPSATPYNSNRMLMAGGLIRRSDGTFSLATASYYSENTGPLYVYMPEYGTSGGISIGNTSPEDDPPPFAILGPSFMGQATSLGDGARVMISGGFGSLAMTPVTHMSLFDERLIAVLRPANDIAELSLTQERGGHTVVNLGTGQLLITGGLSTTSDTGSSSIATTTTIYTDEQEVR